MTIMQGNRVSLRPYQKSDFEWFVREGENFETRLHSQAGVPFAPVERDYEKWLGELTHRGDSYLFMIERSEDHATIGYCTVQNIMWHASLAQVGIEIYSPEFQGKGYGTEAMNLLVDFIFLHINVNKVKLGVFGFNERAIKSYEKCGFQVEARLREEMFRHGRYHDIVLMGLLRREWEARREAESIV